MKLYGTRRLFARATAPPLTYLLRATFDADDVGYANGQVLDTEPEMGANFTGQLTVVEVDGTLAIVSNECAFTAQGTPDWADLGFYSESITKVLGYGLLAQFSVGATNKFTSLVAWKEAQSVDITVVNRYALLLRDTAVFAASYGAASMALYDTYAAATEYQVAILLGGYDVNGVQWYSGAVGVYDYGAAWYVKGGAYTTWTLIWRTEVINTAALYSVMSNYNAAGTLDDFRVPDMALTGAMAPTNVDSFTDANGTSLDAHAPNLGGTWTEHTNQAEIQGNRAQNVTAGAGNNVLATVDSGESDALVEAVLRTTATGFMGMVVRYTDTTHFWGITLSPSLNFMYINEINGGAPVVRASIAVVLNANTDYLVRIIMNAQRISAFVPNIALAACTYAAAAMNENATRHGLWLDDTTSGPGDSNNFAVFARTDAAYDTILDAV